MRDRWQPMRAAIALVGLLAACSPVHLSEDALTSAPPDAGKLTGFVLAVFVTAKMQGQPQVSVLRPATFTTIYEWMVCLKSDAPGPSPTYALFFKKANLVDYRIAVQVDGCDTDAYVPLSAIAPPPPPPPPGKK
jgi:hypothetical protein